MLSRGTRRLLLLLLSLGACDASPPPARSATANVAADARVRAFPDAGASPPNGGAKARQPFVVAMVVDQLSAWLAWSRVPLLPSDGAFARLVREGTWVKELRYPYAVMDTAPGHASLQTGKLPSEHGIFANELPDDQGVRESIVKDPLTRLVTPNGVLDVPGASPARLNAETVADRLRAARPDALVVSVSLKDRAAILPGGKRPTHSIWYDSDAGSFVTSTAFSNTFPKWAVPIADARAVSAARSRPWEPLDRAWLEKYAGKDDQTGEGDREGLGVVFPHVAKTPWTFRALPASDEVLLDIGLSSIAAEYDPSKPTLLLMSLSASDVVSHLYGPDSWEAWDHLRRLDDSLGRFLTTLEQRVGPVSVLLTGDHGTVSMPEKRASNGQPCGPSDRLERPCKGGLRIPADIVRDELMAASTKALGPGHWVKGVADPYVFLTSEGRALPPPRRKLLDDTVRATLAKYKEGIAEIIDVRDLTEKCPKVLRAARVIPDRARVGESVLTLVCRSWAPDLGAGDFYVVPSPGSFFDAGYVLGTGTNHGTPYVYDRTVSLFVRARGTIPEGVTIEQPVDFAAVAALEAALLGIDRVSASDVLVRYRASGR